MVNDERQQELFLQWGKLTPEEFDKWLNQQPDKKDLRKLILQMELDDEGDSDSPTSES